MIKRFELFLEDIKYQNFINDKIDEGYKDITLSLLFLLGLVSGSKAQYAKVIKNPKEGFVDSVENFIENKDNINKLWDIIKDRNKFHNKEEFEKKLITSVDELKERSSEIGSKKIKFKEARVNIKDTKQISQLIKQGFSPKQLLVTKDTIIKNSVVTKNFEFTPEYNTDVIFKTGTSDLTDEFKNNIKQTIETLLSRKDNKVEIYEIQIKTSTDKEPIIIGNKKLSENRANSVKEYLNSIISTDIKTTDDNGNSLILYDQGPDIYSSEMDNEERKLSREKTKQFRYAEITIKYKLVKQGEKPYTYGELIENEELVLIKITKESKKYLSNRTKNTRIRNNNRSKIKIGEIIVDCVY